MGQIIGIIGVAVCVLLCGIGSALGLYKTGTAAAGVLGEDPKKFGKVLVLVLLPATQGIYGFIIGIIASSSLAAGLTVCHGGALFCRALPVALWRVIMGRFSGHVAGHGPFWLGRRDRPAGRLCFLL